jgi:uncharacterized membrane protein YkvI
LFFVDFGIWGMVGALVSAALFTFLGMALAGLGNRLQATSHKQVIQAICGRHLGLLVDWMITFFMFGVTVVMLAGAVRCWSSSSACRPWLAACWSRCWWWPSCAWTRRR